MNHPMQPIHYADDGVIRFKHNSIVRYMLDAGKSGTRFDLNTLAKMNFPREDYEQLAQLIGYSVSGFGDLSYASPEAVHSADEIAGALYRENSNET